MHTLDYDQYKEIGVNITGLRMVEPTAKTVDVIKNWSNWTASLTEKFLNITEKDITVFGYSLH